MFESKTFPITVKRIRNMLTKINISVISLMMFYEHRKTIMCIVIGDLIYTIIDNYICLDDMGLIQENLSKHGNNFEISSSMICLG